MKKPKCKFGNDDTCDGIKGSSGFVCRDCVESDEFQKQLARESAERKNKPNPRLRRYLRNAYTAIPRGHD